MLQNKIIIDSLFLLESMHREKQFSKLGSIEENMEVLFAGTVIHIILNCPHN